MAFDLQLQKMDYNDDRVFGDVYCIAMFPKEIHSEKDPRFLPSFQVQLPNLRLTVKAYVELLDEEDIKISAWFSFNCRDESDVASGESILECASVADSCKQVAAVGVNCTAPRFIHGLISSIEKVTNKPVLLYPNSGEVYDAKGKVWVKSSGVVDEDFVSYVCKWRDAGTSLFGGCYRTTPNIIKGSFSSCLLDY